MGAEVVQPVSAAVAVERRRGPAQRAGLVLLVLVAVGAAWAGVQAFGLGLTPFHTKGEPREAIVVQDLVRNNNWILPRRNGVQLPRKPPLFYWLGGVAAHARGVVDEATVRLPSAVLSGAACLLLAAVVTMLYGGIAGVGSGLALLTSFEWLRAATAARVDMTLAFGLTLVFVGLLMFRRSERGGWLLLLYAGAAWATLSKGIPGLAIPLLQILLLCAVDRSPAFAWRVRPISGLLAVLLVCGAWYAAAAAQGGRDFVSIVVAENFVRAVGERKFSLGHQHGVGYLIGSLLAGLLPWTLLLPSMVLVLWRGRGALDRRDPRLFSVIWICAVFAPYALATSKRGVYLLPLYPAVCLLFGWWLGELVHGRIKPRWLPALLAVAGWLLAVVLGLLALVAGGQAAGVPLLSSVAGLLDPRTAYDIGHVAEALPGRFALALWCAGAAVAALGVAATARLRHWRLAFACLFLCIAAVSIAVRVIIMPAVAEGYTRRDFAAVLRRTVDDPAALHVTAGLDYGTLFYWGAALPDYDREGNAEAPPYLLLPETTWLAMPPAERRRYRRVPGLIIGRANNQGYVAVLERSAPPAAASDQPVE